MTKYFVHQSYVPIYYIYSFDIKPVCSLVKKASPICYANCLFSSAFIMFIAKLPFLLHFFDAAQHQYKWMNVHSYEDKNDEVNSSGIEIRLKMDFVT